MHETQWPLNFNKKSIYFKVVKLKFKNKAFMLLALWPYFETNLFVL